MKIQYTCCCGAKFIAITDAAPNSEAFDKEFAFICKFYEKFKERHASCHKRKLVMAPCEQDDFCR